MKRAVSCVLVTILYLLGVPFRAAAASDMWVSGFYVGYMSSSYPPSAIDYSALTHVMVFSLLPRTDGTLDTTLFIDPVNGPLVARDVAQRAHAAGRKAILVVGGEGTAAGFQGATSAQNMSAFVQNLTQTVAAWGFDGVDIDWEPISSSDYAPLLSLVGALRSARPGIIVTADVPWLNANFALSSADARFYAQLASAVDQMNMMTYGMADKWPGWAVWHSSAATGEGSDHPSSVASSARLYMNAGVAAAKLGMGIGFFGSCWNAPTTAPLQSPGVSYVVAGDNTLGFANLMNHYYNAAAYHYDATADAPYLSFSSPVGGPGCTFISYEDETSVAAKASLARRIGLGGATIWQLNEGYNPNAADGNSLLHAVGRGFLNTSVSATLTSLASSSQPAVFGQNITLSAGVTSADGTPDGTVTFTDGNATIGTSNVSGGSAALSTATLATGSHSITAAYGGSASFAPSASAAVAQTINKAATQATMVSSLNPIVFGQAATLRATVAAVAPGTGTPTGTVTFTDTTTSTTVGSRSLSGDGAALTIAGLAVGTHAMVASFGGSANFLSSASSPLNQVVNLAATTTTLGSSRNPARFGRSVTFTAKVAAALPGTGTPTGTVRFLDGPIVLGSVSLSKGSAAYTASGLSKGSHTITAVYGGSNSYQTSTSVALTQIVE